MVPGVTAGDVVVAGEFTHPRRGAVRCPAAPLVAGNLGGRDIRGFWDTVPEARIPRPPDDCGVLFAVSYLDPDGGVIGLGVAAHPGDRVGTALARETVDAWAGALRTRRVLLATPGPHCVGAERMLAGIARCCAETTGPVVTLSSSPGRDSGVTTDSPAPFDTTELSQIPDGARVVIPAHGVSLALRAEIAARGLDLVDLTCPLVLAAQARVREFAADGHRVVVVGRAGHAVLAGLLGQAPEATIAVQTVAEVDTLTDLDPERLSFVLAPGMPVEDASRVLTALRARFGRPRGQGPNEWCYAASDRREALRSVAAASNLLLVCGRADDQDTRDTLDWAATASTRVRLLSRLGQLQASWLASADTVGLAVTATAGGLVEQVLGVLSGLGPLSVVRRAVTSTVDPRPAVDRVPAGGDHGH